MKSWISTFLHIRIWFKKTVRIIHSLFSSSVLMLASTGADNLRAVFPPTRAAVLKLPQMRRTQRVISRYDSSRGEITKLSSQANQVKSSKHSTMQKCKAFRGKIPKSETPGSCNSGPLIYTTWKITGIQLETKWTTRWNRYDRSDIRNLLKRSGIAAYKERNICGVLASRRASQILYFFR